MFYITKPTSILSLVHIACHQEPTQFVRNAKHNPKSFYKIQLQNVCQFKRHQSTVMEDRRNKQGNKENQRISLSEMVAVESL